MTSKVERIVVLESWKVGKEQVAGAVGVLDRRSSFGCYTAQDSNCGKGKLFYISQKLVEKILDVPSRISVGGVGHGS